MLLTSAKTVLSNSRNNNWLKNPTSHIFMSVHVDVMCTESKFQNDN